MPRLPRLHHFAISVADLEVAAAWYVEHLGFELEFSYDLPENGIRATFLTLEDFRLEIFEVPDSRPQPDEDRRFDSYLSTRGLKHIAIEVAELESTRLELERRGVSFVTPVLDVPRSGGERFCFLQDPSGTFIELYQPVAAHQREH